MYQLEITTKFKKDVKRSIKRGLNQDLLYEAIQILLDKGELPLKI